MRGSIRALMMGVVGLAACGGDDGAGGPADAAAVDAFVAAADAAVDAAPGAFLGLSCPENACPGDSRCLTIMAGQGGYCTIPCGESNVIGNRPTAGDAICEAIYDETVGTPICGIPIDFGPPVRWDCAIDCTADGLCPGDLTCQDFNFSRYCLR